ncbi:hypothetical protein SADUNF_Sadunf04G0118600 [Salix dunnii]|uniref:Uncharacterized protein n=1 Tax=Salix dunnii TaxID=1413687 RepID=A0A835N2X5_9ROSI|nr:hypothetical protein SADUNF_Sadunf04G0118600 [Salix dunnii]
MSCFRPGKKRSFPNKVWKGFISTLQKRLKSLETSKFHSKKTSQYRLQRHHLYDRHFKHFYRDQKEDSYGAPTGNMAGPLLIESTHARYLDMERKMNKAVFVTNDTERVYDEQEDGDKSDDDTSFASCETTEQHGVDAFAEEFIYKMKRVWKHENQKSEEDCVESWKECRVDAIAEDFINKMRGSWKLEKQRSVEEYIQRWTRLHEF